MPETHRDFGEETARFQAFQERNDDVPSPWRMKAPGGRIALLAVIVIVVACLAVIVGVLLVG